MNVSEYSKKIETITDFVLLQNTSIGSLYSCVLACKQGSEFCIHNYGDTSNIDDIADMLFNYEKYCGQVHAIDYTDNDKKLDFVELAIDIGIVNELEHLGNLVVYIKYLSGKYTYSVHSTIIEDIILSGDSLLRNINTNELKYENMQELIDIITEILKNRY